ncbi:hypothetical protein L1887_55319 [Cichorium endivia]|nr:hypothetical protein L1887_55319 [Cichorium endivia]
MGSRWIVSTSEAAPALRRGSMASMPRNALLAMPNNKTKTNGSPTVSVERNSSTRQQERADHLSICLDSRRFWLLLGGVKAAETARPKEDLVHIQRTLVPLSAMRHPSCAAHDGDDGDDDNGVVHVGGRGGQFGREEEEDVGEEHECDGKHVDRQSQPAQVKVSSALRARIVGIQHLPAPNEQQNNRDDVRELQQDHAGAEDGVEGRGGAEVDATKHDDPDGGQHEGWDGHLVLRRDALQKVGEGQATVACKGLAHARRGGQQRCGSERHAAHGEDEQTNCTRLVADGLVDDLQQRPRRRLDHRIKVAQHKQEHHEHDKRRRGPDGHCQDHGSRRIDRRPVDLVDQMRCTVRTNQREGRLKQAQDPRHTIVPSGLVDVLAKDEFGVLVVRGGACKAGDHDHHGADEAPDHGCAVERVEDAHAERIDHPGAEAECDVHQKDVPWLALVVRMQQRNDPDDKLAGEARCGRGQGHPSSHSGPSGKVGDHVSVSCGGETKAPVILSSRRRVDVADLGHGKCGCHDADKGNHHTPQCHRGPAADERDRHGGRGGRPAVQDAVAQADERERRKVRLVDHRDGARGRGRRRLGGGAKVLGGCARFGVRTVVVQRLRLLLRALLVGQIRRGPSFSPSGTGRSGFRARHCFEERMDQSEEGGRDVDGREARGEGYMGWTKSESQHAHQGNDSAARGEHTDTGLAGPISDMPSLPRTYRVSGYLQQTGSEKQYEPARGRRPAKRTDKKADTQPRLPRAIKKRKNDLNAGMSTPPALHAANRRLVSRFRSRFARPHQHCEHRLANKSDTGDAQRCSVMLEPREPEALGLEPREQGFEMQARLHPPARFPAVQMC